MNDCGLKSEISPISKSIMQFSGGDSGGNESDRGFFNRKRLWANSPIKGVTPDFDLSLSYQIS